MTNELLAIRCRLAIFYLDEIINELAMRPAAYKPLGNHPDWREWTLDWSDPKYQLGGPFTPPQALASKPARPSRPRQPKAKKTVTPGRRRSSGR